MAEESYASYIIWNHEIAPDTGTKHLQGYMELYRAIRMATLKKKLGIRSIHLEQRLGSQAEAIAYSSKLDSRDPDYHDPMIYGVPKRHNAAYGSAVDQVLANFTMQEVARNHPQEFVRYHRGLSALAMQIAPRRSWAMEITVLYGPTGSGKSYSAYQLAGDSCFTPEWPPGPKAVWWWQGYDGQDTIILDEFRCQVPYSTILRLFDRYAFQVQSKGLCHEFSSKKIIVTTNIHPTNWYNREANTSHLLRRLHDFADVYEFSLPLQFTVSGEPIPQARQIHVRNHPNPPCSLRPNFLALGGPTAAYGGTQPSQDGSGYGPDLG